MHPAQRKKKRAPPFPAVAVPPRPTLSFLDSRFPSPSLPFVSHAFHFLPRPSPSLPPFPPHPWCVIRSSGLLCASKSRRECLGSYRAVLALHAGAVEAQRRHTLADTLHVHHALVAPLARLWLRKVAGPQGDGSDLAGRDEDFTGVKELGAVLRK